MTTPEDKNRRWPSDDLSLLRQRWKERVSPGIIAAELNQQTSSGKVYSSICVSVRATLLKLPPRRELDLYQDRIIELRRQKATRRRIATALGKSPNWVHERVRTLMAYGLVPKMRRSREI